jgi:hypothetical protein
MVARLGFALSTALDPEVLLMDEAIGTGDARFAERAAIRMKEFLGRSSIIVLASHVTALVKSICNKAALMNAGRLVALGPVDEIFDMYRASMHGTEPRPAGEQQHQIKQDWQQAEFTPAAPLADQFAQCLGGRIETVEGEPGGSPAIHRPFKVCLHYRLLKDSPFSMVPHFHFLDREGETLLVSSPMEPSPTDQGDYVASCVVDPFVFNVGRYAVALALTSAELAEPAHFFADALRFEVVEPRGVDPRRHGYENEIPGVMRTRLAWQITKV